MSNFFSNGAERGAMKFQLLAAATHTLIFNKPKYKYMLVPYQVEYRKQKGLESGKNIDFHDFIDFLLDNLPKGTQFDMVEGKIEFRDLPEYGIN